MDLASKRAISAVGRDECGQRYTRSVRKQARDLSSRRPTKNDFNSKAAKGRKGLGSEGRTSPILRMFSLRDFSSNPRSLLRPKRTLSPSNLYVNRCRWSICCSRAHAIVDYVRDDEIARYPKRYGDTTLPLALSPVNQIVTPFCCRRSTLSLMSTDPSKSVSDRALIRRTSHARTRMECDIGSHCQIILAPCLVVEEKVKERIRFARHNFRLSPNG